LSFIFSDVMQGEEEVKAEKDKNVAPGSMEGAEKGQPAVTKAFKHYKPPVFA
jgi:hypothetical protein